MKKFYVILILFIILSASKQALADDLGMNEASSSVENAWYGQKQITDEDFEKTLTKLEEKKKKSKQKKLKGKSLTQEDYTPNHLNELTDKNLLLSLPVDLLTINGEAIPVGHYNIVGKKVKEKVYLEFRQSHSVVATVEALETEQDFGESAINFVKLLPYNETKVKIIYGSLEFNAATFINIKNGLN